MIQPFLTCALAVCEDIARLTGECLVALEGAWRVHTVLGPGARMQVRHTLIDVCVEIEAAVRACRGSRYIGLAQPGTGRQEAPGSDLRYSPCREKHKADVPLSKYPFIQQRFITPFYVSSKALGKRAGCVTKTEMPALGADACICNGVAQKGLWGPQWEEGRLR